MKYLAVLPIVVALLCSLAAGEDKPSQDTAGKEKAAAVEKKTATAPQRVTGADGKTYIVKQTPFGATKVEDKPEEKEEPPAGMRAFEEGDSVRFESQTPFGVAKWKKKKSELNEMEQNAVERERRRQKDRQSGTKQEASK